MEFSNESFQETFNHSKMENMPIDRKTVLNYIERLDLIHDMLDSRHLGKI